MTTKTYVLASLAAFIVVLTASDITARMTVAGDTFASALHEHTRWLSLTIVGAIVLFVPFAGTALICGAASKRAKTRGVVLLFSAALIVLAYYYFYGFHASQSALLQKKWTAAALSIGLLPFYVGLPLLLFVATIAAVLTRIDRQPTAEV